MQVRLMAITQPIDGSTPEQFIAQTARVSNPSNQMNHETAPKLIQYLIKNKHWSPLEQVSATLEIKTTRDIARQILRHRTFTFQEFSQRYAAVVDEPVIRQARRQDLKNRQNSIDDVSEEDAEWFRRMQETLTDLTSRFYKEALDRGIAKEQARVILPEGNTPSTIYLTGSVRSWFHYIELRSGNGTQLEHREIALEAKRILSEHFPNIFNLIT